MNCHPREHQLQLQFPVGNGGKTYQQPVPLFARRPPMRASDSTWPAYCGLLKDLGIPLQVPQSAFEQLSVSKVPPRFARRNYAKAFAWTNCKLLKRSRFDASLIRARPVGPACHWRSVHGMN